MFIILINFNDITTILRTNSMFISFNNCFIRAEDRILYKMLFNLFLFTNLYSNSLIIFLPNTIWIISSLKFPFILFFQLFLINFTLEFRRRQTELLSLIPTVLIIKIIGHTYLLEIFCAKFIVAFALTPNFKWIIMGTLFILFIHSTLISILISFYFVIIRGFVLILRDLV